MRTPILRAGAAAVALVFAVGCASTTVIKSMPSGAKVYLDGEVAGTTPFAMTDTKIVGSVTRVRLVLDGYQPLETVITRNEQFDVGACIGGALVLVPWLWIMGYKPDHTYELSPLQASLGPVPRG
jgi:hypothetical protein